MAYLRDLDTTCLLCKSKATVELINRYNDRMGKFCKKCGKKRLESLLESEKINNG